MPDQAQPDRRDTVEPDPAGAEPGQDPTEPRDPATATSPSERTGATSDEGDGDGPGPEGDDPMAGEAPSS